jgi:oligopeptide/dipeptide ABC transporter ATP-binding protein
VTAQSVLRIVPAPGSIRSGSITLRRPEAEITQLYTKSRTSQEGRAGDSIELAGLDDRSPLIRAIRGKAISMIFQEPMTSLSPVHTIGFQIMEAILLHRTPNKAEAREIALDMIAKVGISNPGQRIDEYPFQLSGGMRQRAMIAMALSCNPALLIADEPTTALDVTVQAQILELIKGLQEQFGMAIQYITHDLGVIAEIAQQIAVMYLGRIVEQGSPEHIFRRPLHPYTTALLRSVPKLGKKSTSRLETIQGTVPIPLDPPPMCGFFSRCTRAMPGKCDRAIPALVEMEPGHSVRCFLHSEEQEAPADDAGTTIAAEAVGSNA